MSPQPHDFHIGFNSFFNFYTMRPHWHEHLEFTYITSGVGQFIIDGEAMNVQAGERGIIETTKKNADFSRVVTVNSISL